LLAFCANAWENGVKLATINPLIIIAAKEIAVI